MRGFIGEALEAVAGECNRQLMLSGFSDDLRNAITEHNPQVLFAGHPRSLTILPLTAYEGIGSGNSMDAIAAGAAMEFLLAAGDVLDDLQDSAPTLDVPHWSGERCPSVQQTEVLTALLLLSERALVSVSESIPSRQRVLRAISLFSEFKMRAFAGQYSDVRSSAKAVGGPATSSEITKQKSGSVGRCAGMLGASLASDDPEVISLVGDFGEHFAIASQMNNDIADLWPSSGKLNDLTQLRNTAPIAFALAVTSPARPIASQALRAMQTTDQDNRPSLHPELEQARDEVFRSGGVQFAIALTAVQLTKARTIGRKLQQRFPGSRLLSLLESG